VPSSWAAGHTCLGREMVITQPRFCCGTIRGRIKSSYRDETRVVLNDHFFARPQQTLWTPIGLNLDDLLTSCSRAAAQASLATTLPPHDLQGTAPRAARASAQ
jgi:hypothetical protein